MRQDTKLIKAFDAESLHERLRDFIRQCNSKNISILNVSTFVSGNETCALVLYREPIKT